MRSLIRFLLVLSLFGTSPALGASPVPSPETDAILVQTIAPDERIFVVSEKDFTYQPKTALGWLRLRRFLSLSSQTKADHTVAILNHLALKMQRNFTRPTDIENWANLYNRELETFANLSVPKNREVLDPALGDFAMQYLLLERIVPVVPESAKSKLKETQQQVLEQTMGFIDQPGISDSDRRAKLTYFVSTYLQKEDKNKKLVKKESLKNAITHLKVNQKIKDDLNTSAMSTQSEPESSEGSSSSTSSSSSSTNIKVESKTSNSSTSSTVAINIVISGKSLKNSSKFSVPKGSNVEIKFKNNDATKRKLVFSNGITSEESSNGQEVTIKPFTLTESITFSVPGDSLAGSISII